MTFSSEVEWAVSAKVSDTKIATKRAFQNKHLLLVDHRETGTKVSSTGYQVLKSVLKTITRATRGRKHMPLHTKLDHVVSLSTLGEKISNIAIGETFPQLASGITFRVRIHIECLVRTDTRGCNSYIFSRATELPSFTVWQDGGLRGYHRLRYD